MAASTSVFEVVCCAPTFLIDEEEYFETLSADADPQEIERRERHEVTGYVILLVLSSFVRNMFP